MSRRDSSRFDTLTPFGDSARPSDRTFAPTAGANARFAGKSPLIVHILGPFQCPTPTPLATSSRQARAASWAADGPRSALHEPSSKSKRGARWHLGHVTRDASASRAHVEPITRHQRRVTQQISRVVGRRLAATALNRRSPLRHRLEDAQDRGASIFGVHPYTGEALMHSRHK
jgi:hypothetical protein